MVAAKWSGGKRVVLTRRWISVAFWWLLFSGIVSARTITGCVYNDTNSNGMLDAGERGIPKVLVSDGIRFAQTDANGLYQLEVNASDDPQLAEGGWPVVSVSWPTGTWPTSIWWRNTQQIGESNTCNFGLRPEAQSLPFLFVHATDVHVSRGGLDKLAQFRSDVTQMAGTIKFAVLTGDLLDLGDRQDPATVNPQISLFNEKIGGFPVPVFCTLGTHDAPGIRPDSPGSWDPSDANRAYRWYTRDVGPLRWSFNCAGIHFVGLDYLSRSPDGSWQDTIAPTAVTWLADDLARLPPDTRIFLFVHYFSDNLATVVQQYHVEHIFFGHIHMAERTTWNGVAASQAGSISMMAPDAKPDPAIPNALRIGYDVVLTDESVTPEYYALGHPYVPSTNNWVKDFRNRLRAHWKLDEAAGEIARDNAGGNDGTLHGHPFWRPADGRVDGALQFDGARSYVSTPFVLNPVDGEFSVFCWVKGGTPGQVILSQTGDPIGVNWLATAPSNGSLMTELRASARGGSALTSPVVVTDDQWHHIGVTWDGSYRTLYVDGVAAAQDTVPLTRLQSINGGLYFGAGKVLEAAGFLTGQMDDIRIYNKALTPADVQ